LNTLQVQSKLKEHFDQDATAVEEKVRELQERVEALMIAIVRNVTAGSEETKIVAAGKAIENDLKDLLECVIFACMQVNSD